MINQLAYKILQLQPREQQQQAITPIIVYNYNLFYYQPKLWTNLLPPSGLDVSLQDSVMATPFEEQKIAFSKGKLLLGLNDEDKFVWHLN